MITLWLMNHWKPLALALGVAILVGGAVHLWKEGTIASLNKQQTELRQQNQKITDEYWEAIGERNALRVQAQQFKLEADAYRQAGEQRGANVAALDKKIDVVRGQYEEIQNTVGDCSSVAECRKQLCEKYKQAGIRLKDCPD